MGCTQSKRNLHRKHSNSNFNKNQIADSPLNQKIEQGFQNVSNVNLTTTIGFTFDSYFRSKKQLEKSIEVEAIEKITNDFMLTFKDLNHNEHNQLSPLQAIESKYLLSWNDIVIKNKSIDIVGQGSFGLVIKAAFQTNDNVVVVKIIQSKSLIQDYTHELKKAEDEVRIHLDAAKQIMNKDCIVKVYGLVKGELPKDLSNAFGRIEGYKAAGIVMHYEAGGTLSSLIHNRDSADAKLTMSSKIRILSQIALALAELHKYGIIHGDLKPDNVLLSCSDLSQAVARLSDFGLAVHRNDSILGETSLVESAHEHGTRLYMAPEQHVDAFGVETKIGVIARSSAKTDMYSFAILAWELLSEQKPFSELNLRKDNIGIVINQGIRPDLNKLPTDCNLSIRDMIECCWDLDRSVRKSAVECRIILSKCYDQLVNMPFDILLSYRYDSQIATVISYVRNHLFNAGFKILERFDKKGSVQEMKNCISKCKFILCIVDELYQKSNRCLFELQCNRDLKHPRRVIPLFLQTRSPSFPDDEMKVHFQMAARSTDEIFDISNALNNEFVLEDCNTYLVDIELDKLNNYLRKKVNTAEIIFEIKNNLFRNYKLNHHETIDEAMIKGLNHNNYKQLSPLQAIESKFLLSWNDIILKNKSIDIVGQGSFGLVIKAAFQTNDNVVVVKIIQSKSLIQDYTHELKNAEDEVRIHLDAAKQIMNKDCIVKVYGLVKGELPKDLSNAFGRIEGYKAAGIVMHYEAGGTLSSLIHNRDSADAKLTMSSKIRILSQIALALTELHKYGIIHGDLKPDNVLLSCSDLSQAVARLSDFGLAVRRNDNILGETSLVESVHEHGTRLYMAPEQHVDVFGVETKIGVIARSSAKTDMYSFAILAWELLSEQKPFSELNLRKDNIGIVINQGIRPDLNKLPTDCNLSIRDMIECCWDLDRSVRKSAVECRIILSKCYDQLVNMPFDILLSYRYDSQIATVISYVRNHLFNAGFKVFKYTQLQNNKEEMKNCISKCKFILCIVDELYQKSNHCLFELQCNRDLKHPRRVIPLFLQTRSPSFPDDEMKVHFQMAARSTDEIFDISNALNNEFVLEDCNTYLVDIELDKLNDYLNEQIHGLLTPRTDIRDLTYILNNDVNKKDSLFYDVFPKLIDVSREIPVFKVVADTVKEFYDLLFKLYCNYSEFKILKNSLEQLLDVLIKSSSTIIHLIKYDKEYFDLHFEKVIFALKQSNEVISFLGDQFQKGVEKAVLSKRFKEKIIESSSILSFETQALSFNHRVNEISSLTAPEISFNDDLLEILQYPMTNFNADIEIHIRKMKEAGRLWLNAKVFQWLNDPNGSRLFFLQANGGIGKTAYVSSLKHFYSDQVNIWGVFFCKFEESKRSNGYQIVLSLAYQIAQAYPPYKDRLLEEDYARRIVAQIGIMTWNEFFVDLIKLPLSECEKAGHNMKDTALIIIDAVDEIEKTADEKRKDFLNFLVFIINKLPPFIRLLITGRPEPDIVEAFKHMNPFVIKETDPNHLRDLEEYLRIQLAEILVDRTELEEAVVLVFEKSEGKFVYPAIVMKTIEDQCVEKLTITELRKLLPDGINDVYKREFKRIKLNYGEDCFNNELMDLIKLIVVMRRKLTVKEVAMILKMKVTKIISLSKMISSLFPLCGENGKLDEDKYFTLFHKTLLDWITDKNNENEQLNSTDTSFYIDIKDANNVFANKLFLQIDINNNSYIEWKFPEDKNSYLINHLLDHLDGADRQQEARELLMSLPWMMKTVEDRGVVALIGEFKSRQGVWKKNSESRQIKDLIVSLAETNISSSINFSRIVRPLKLLFSWIGNNNINEFNNNYITVNDKNDFNIAFKIIVDSLKLSHATLSNGDQKFPKRLPIQLNGRLNDILMCNNFLNNLRKSCSDWCHNNLVFLPKRLYLEAPGGVLENKFQFKQSINALALMEINNEEMIAVAHGNNIEILNILTGDIELKFQGHTDAIKCVAVLSDGRIVSGGCDKTLRVWNLSTRECEQVLHGHEDFVTCIAVLPNERVVSGSYDKTLHIWNIKTGVCEQVLNGHSNYVNCVAVLLDGRVVSGGNYNTVRVWNTTSGECEKVLLGHSNDVSCIAVLPDGRVVSGSFDYSLRLWNVRTGECEQVLDEHSYAIKCVAVLSDGRVVSGGRDKTLRVWNLITCECEQVLLGHEDNINCVAVLSDGRVVSGGDDNTLRLWNTNTSTTTYEQKTRGHTKRVTCVAVLRHGRVVSGSDDNTLRVWNISTGECEYVLKGHSYGVHCVAVLLDGRVVSGSGDIFSFDNNLRVWNTETGECEKVLNGHGVWCVGVLLDGRVVSGGFDSSLHIWNITTGECVLFLKGHTLFVTCVKVLPDGRVVSGSLDTTLRVWNTTTGECERVLRGHSDYAVKITTTLNDEFIKSEGNNGYEIIWNVNTGEKISQQEYAMLHSDIHNTTTRKSNVNPLMEMELSTEDHLELESYGLENGKSAYIATKDVIVWGYSDGNVIIFQRN